MAEPYYVPETTPVDGVRGTKYRTSAAILSCLFSGDDYVHFHRYLKSTGKSLGFSPNSLPLPSHDEYKAWFERPHPTIPYMDTNSLKLLAHPLFCTHPTCLPSAIRSAKRGFLGGYITIAMLNILPTVLFRRTKLLDALKEALRSSSPFTFAAFFSSFSFIYKLLLRSFTLYPPTSRSKMVPPFLAGFLASLSIVLDKSSPDRRIFISLYVFTKSLQIAYNALRDNGIIPVMPWWWGSWLLFPLSSAQLIWSFAREPETFPEAHEKFIVSRSTTYLSQKPTGAVSWPTGYQIVRSMEPISGELHYPRFDVNKLDEWAETIPEIALVLPVLKSADPSHSNLMCALLHPHDTSCTRTCLRFMQKETLSAAKLMTALILIRILTRWRHAQKNPLKTIRNAALNITSGSLLVSGSIGTSWAMICLLQRILPNSFMSADRYIINGFAGGLWILLEPPSRRLEIGLYSIRFTIENIWKLLLKKGYVRNIPNGEAIYFAFATGIIMTVYHTQPASLNAGLVAALLKWINS